MRYSILHHGIAVGTVELAVDGGKAKGVVSVLPAYETIRALVRRATSVVSEVRDHSKLARSERRERFREAAELTRELALRDETGHTVASDYIVLRDSSDAEPPMLTAMGVRENMNV
jgi:hypothetical protein